MRKFVFANDNFYHVFNRGVDKRNIFNESGDYKRFIQDLFEFNDEEPTKNFCYYLYRAPTTIENRGKLRKLLVDIICFCLMPNHFHLVLKQLKEGGISKFMQKLIGGYTKYYNLKYGRNGVLFQGKFKAVPIETDAHILHLSRYIHLNPIELVEQGWKEKGITDWIRIKKFLDSYHWSSYHDYIGQKQFSYLIKPEIISEQFQSPREYENFIKSWVVKDISDLGDLILE